MSAAQERADVASAPSRHTWMDLVRGLAVLLIVAWHAVSVPQLFDGYRAPDQLLALNDVLRPYRIPALLVLSGLLLPRSLAKGPARYALGKIRHILWPYALWMVLILAASGGLARITQPTLWLGGNIYWFMGVLLVCYALAALRIAPVPWLMYAGFLLAAFQFLQPENPAVVRVLWFAPFFFIGAALADRIEEFQWQLSPAAAACLAAVVALGSWLVLRGTIEDQSLMFLMLSVTGVLLVVWAAPRIPRAPIVRALEWYGRHSIVVYLGHALAMYAVLTPLRGGEFANSPWVMPLLLTVGLALPTLLIAIRPKVAWLFSMPWPELAPAPAPRGEGSVPRETSRPRERERI